MLALSFNVFDCHLIERASCLSSFFRVDAVVSQRRYRCGSRRCRRHRGGTTEGHLARYLVVGESHNAQSQQHQNGEASRRNGRAGNPGGGGGEAPGSDARSLADHTGHESHRGWTAPAPGVFEKARRTSWLSSKLSWRTLSDESIKVQKEV